MTDYKERSNGALVIALALMVLLGLPVLYILSIGPIAWLDSRGYLPEWAMEVVSVVYVPLEYLAQSSELTQEWAEWYVNFWI